MLSKSSSYSIAHSVVVLALVGAYVAGYVGQLVKGLPIIGDFPDYSTFLMILALVPVVLRLGVPVSVVWITSTVASFLVLTVHQIPLIRYMTLAAVLFSIGVYGMVVSRNAVRVLISIELLLNAVNINLVTLARYVDPVYVRGQLFAVFVLTIAAAEAAVGLAIVLTIYRNLSTVDMEKFNLLKW